MSIDTNRPSDKELAVLLREALDIDQDAPGFDAVFAAAERRYRSARRRPLWAAAAAVAAAAAMLPFLTGSPTPEPEYIRLAELMETTQWSAPSDALLPTRRFDIYQELPVLIESTKAAEGALL